MSLSVLTHKQRMRIITKLIARDKHKLAWIVMQIDNEIQKHNEFEERLYKRLRR